MSPLTITFVIGILITVAIVVMVARKTRSSLAQISLAVVLLAPILFCVFGFAATFEPMDASTQWLYRMIYGAVGLGLAATSLFVLIRRPSPSDR